MALNFPKDPPINYPYTEAGTTWVWDGGKWTSKGLASGLPIYPDENGNVVITGSLVVNSDITATGDLGGTNLGLSGNATINGDGDIEGNLNVAGDIDND